MMEALGQTANLQRDLIPHCRVHELLQTELCGGFYGSHAVVMRGDVADTKAAAMCTTKGVEQIALEALSRVRESGILQQALPKTATTN